MKAGDVYQDTQTPGTFTLREPGVSFGSPGWHGTRSDYGEWFVTDYALGLFYLPVKA